MKIVIATPPGRFPENRYPCPFPSRWTSVFKDYPIFIFFPYQLAYLSSLLKRELPDMETKMVDGTWLRFGADDYVKQLTAQKPDWLVFETDTVTYAQTLLVAQQVKEKCGTRIIMTGQYPTTFPQKVLDDGADYACIGEYEATVLDILKGEDPKGISGLFPNRHRKLIDIDWLPDPEDDDIRRIDYSYSGGCRWTRYREVEIHASRGCPYKCDFCVAGNVYYEKPNWRFRKPARIINEIETLRRKYPQMEGVFFDEETHIVKKRVIMEFCDAIIASGNNDLHYEAMANHQLMDEEILEKLKEAGYYKLRIGIETIDERTSKSIGRKTKADRLENLLVVAKKIGIEIYGTFIIGASGSTAQGDLATIEYGSNLIRNELIGSYQASIAVPHPGTPFHEKAVKNGWMNTDNPEHFNGISGSVLNYPDYSNAEINKSIETLHKKFSEAKPHDTVNEVKSLAMEKTALRTKERDKLRYLINSLEQIFESGDYEKTLAEASKVLKECPQSLRARHLIGAAHLRQGKADEAKREFKKIIEIATDYADALAFAYDAHFHLGWIANMEEKKEEALFHFRHSMHLNPVHQLSRRFYWILTEPEKTLEIEKSHWDKFETEAAKNLTAMPPWVDLRRAKRVENMHNFWADPETEETIRGREKRRILEILDKPEIENVLEIGCGSGWLSLELARLGKKVTGIDLSSKRIELARRVASEQELKIEYIQADALHYCENGRKFDAVVAWDALHHIPNIPRLFRGINNMLPPNGSVVFYEHMGSYAENRAMAKAILDTSRFAAMPRRNGSNGHEDEDSPYEDVGGFLLEDMIRLHFNIINRSLHTAYTTHIAEGIDLNVINDEMKSQLMEMLKELKASEDILIAKNIFKGEYLFIEAKVASVKA